MSIDRVFCSLVKPTKNREPEPVLTTELKLDGKLYKILSAILDKAPKECTIPIIFVSEDKKHVIKDQLENIIVNQKSEDVESFFTKLSRVTSTVSGISLCFVVIEKSENSFRAIVARFPAAEALHTKISKENFSIEVVEDIFMKNARTYKAAYFEGTSPKSDLWLGTVVDKQINDSVREVSEYWVKDFLQAELNITSKSGTAQLAKAVKKALEAEAEPKNQQKIISFSNLVQNKDGQVISMDKVCKSFSMENEIVTKLQGSLDNPDFFTKTFRFDSEEFLAHNIYRTVYLSSGAILAAREKQFDSCFTTENVSEDRVVYRAEGTVTDIKIRKRL